jgi:hypothetical protein
LTTDIFPSFWLQIWYVRLRVFWCLGRKIFFKALLKTVNIRRQNFFPDHHPWDDPIPIFLICGIFNNKNISVLIRRKLQFPPPLTFEQRTTKWCNLIWKLNSNGVFDIIWCWLKWLLAMARWFQKESNIHLQGGINCTFPRINGQDIVKFLLFNHVHCQATCDQISEKVA